MATLKTSTPKKSTKKVAKSPKKGVVKAKRTLNPYLKKRAEMSSLLYKQMHAKNPAITFADVLGSSELRDQYESFKASHPNL